MKTTILAFGCMLALASAPVAADTLLIERVGSEQGMNLPPRGISMAQVEARYGAPQQKLAPVAGPGPRSRNPPITRWVYPGFVVYFEHNHVVDAVLIRASQTEAGPAPVRR
jgi:hypothetical protein